jgi:hypothetical protein
MISGRLVNLIECNGEQIIDRVAAQFRREPEMTHSRSLVDLELRELGRDLLHNLGNWLSTGNGHDLALRFERFGRLCCEEQIPLDEALRGLFLLREKMLDHAQENMISNSSIELYAEEELDRRLGRFFDRLAIHLVRGFEQAVRKPAAAAFRPAIH